MADTASFAKLVPGFDFLQGLVKNAGAALPSMGQWIAPTINPEELQKRIEELKTVQFWLEQNARMIATTIQALEVQRMTLSTLQTMNVQMTDLRDAMKLAPVASMTSAAGAAASSVAQSFGAEALMQAAKSAMVGSPKAPPEPPPAPEPAPEPAAAPAAKPRPAKAAKAAEPPPMVDPMQWWGALTKQFTQLAANAMKDSATDAAKNFAGAMIKQGVDVAGGALKQAVKAPAVVAQKAMTAATQAAGATGAAAAARKAAAAEPKSGGGARRAPAKKRAATGGARSPRAAKTGA